MQGGKSILPALTELVEQGQIYVANRRQGGWVWFRGDPKSHGSSVESKCRETGRQIVTSLTGALTIVGDRLWKQSISHMAGYLYFVGTSTVKATYFLVSNRTPSKLSCALICEEL